MTVAAPSTCYGTPMTYIEELEAAFTRHFGAIAEKRCWNGPVVRNFASGAVAEYVADNLVIRFVNERGLLDVEVGPASLPGRTFSLGVLKEWLKPPQKGHWNISLAEASTFLDENWLRLSDEMSLEKAQATVEALARLGGP